MSQVAAWGATLRNVASLSAAQAAGLLMQLVAFAVLASSVGPEGAGVYSLGLAFVLLFQYGTELGLQGVVVRDIAQHQAREGELIPNLLYLRFMLGTLAYAVVAALVTLLEFSHEIVQAALIVGLVLPMISLEAFDAALQARLQMGRMAAARVVQAAVMLGGTLLLSHAEATVNGYLWLYVVATAARVLIVLVLGYRAASEPDWRPRLAMWAALWRVAIPIAVAVLLTTGYSRIDTVLLGATHEATDVGQYGVAYRFLDTFGVFAGIVQVSVAPVLARAWLESEATLRRSTHAVMRAGLVMAVPIAIGGAMVGWRLVPAIPGLSAFSGAGRALSILCLACVTILLGHIIHTTMIVGHQQRLLIGIAAFGLAVNVPVTLLLIYPFSYIGAAVATVITECAVFGISTVLLRRRLEIRLPGGQEVRTTLISVAIMAAALSVGFLVNVYAQIALGIVVYIASAIALGAIRRDHLALLWGRRADARARPTTAGGAPG
jgi:O-antigen/teichoic acid export membrane protein